MAKVDNIDTSDFVLKTKYNTDKTELEKKIPDVSNLVKKTKLTELENKIPDISNSWLTDHNHDKYLDTSEFNKLAADAFNARLAQANLITKIDFDAKLSSCNRKIIQNKTKHLLVENEFKKLTTFDSSYYIGKSYFEEDGTPNYLIFQPLNKYFKKGDGNFYYVLSWTSTGLSNESIKPPTTSDNSLTPILNYYGTKIKVSFDRTCLRHDKVTFNHRKMVNIYIAYKIIRYANINGNRNSNLTVQHAFFGAVSLTKNADVNKYKYSGYGIALGRTSSFHFQVVELVKM